MVSTVLKGGNRKVLAFLSWSKDSNTSSSREPTRFSANERLGRSAQFVLHRPPVRASVLWSPIASKVVLFLNSKLKVFKGNDYLLPSLTL